MSLSTPRLARVAPAFVLLLLGCSSGTSSTTSPEGGVGPGVDGGSEPDSGGAGAVPRVTFDSAIYPGTHSATECSKTGTSLVIGSFGNPATMEPVRPVSSGATEGTGTASVTCSVVPAGNGFQVRAHAELTGAAGGAITLTGTMTAAGDQTGISASLTKAGETFADTSCNARYDASLGQGIAAGRVWADLDCLNAANGASAQICAARAQFRFENCTQQ